MLVFMGGTCNESEWRSKLLKKVGGIKSLELFDPVVKDWNEEAQKKEFKMRKTADIVLYVITPKMTGVYSIAEVIDDSNKRPKKTVFAWVPTDEDEEFDKAQKKSLDMVGKMVEENGGKFFNSLKEVANYLKDQVDMNEGIKIMKEVK